MNKALEVKDLGKSYRTEMSLLKTLILPFQGGRLIRALESLSFIIKPGEILGIVGINGAGKTTLLKILAGLLQQDQGQVEILGLNYKSASRELRSKIGYVSSDERSFFWRLSGRDNLEFFGRLYGLSSEGVRSRVGRLLREFQFEKKADHLFGEYSAGMRKKVAVMRALLHEPPILLLDEVTNSLDPGSAAYVKGVVRNYICEGSNRAAVWSTHRLEEIPDICDYVISIDSGKIVSAGKVPTDFTASATGEYLLRTKSMNGQLETFCAKFQSKLQDTNARDDLTEFIFKNINDDEFSKIVTVAVKSYGAHVLFAGYLEKQKEGDVS